MKETYGPVLAVDSVKDYREAASRITLLEDYSLVSVFTNDKAIVDHFSSEILSSNLYINSCHEGDVKLPWTFFSDSGNGVEHSKFNFYHYLRASSFIYRHDG